MLSKGVLRSELERTTLELRGGDCVTNSTGDNRVLPIKYDIINSSKWIITNCCIELPNHVSP